MARLTNLLLLSAVSTGAAFAPTSQIASSAASVQSATQLQESFGFDFAEDQAENTPAVILGEANYKQWVGENVENSFLNRQVCACFTLSWKNEMTNGAMDMLEKIHEFFPKTVGKLDIFTEHHDEE